ncbi:hypothetical protein BDN70DRAFT_896565 [Pholiota conissans]|uniref:Uncharacterized protein n=1 Tax=Pholiota conissans TaxID=109636 RepID=A0A9P6CRT6_9AGAR|nr:hypothetical protein BDN70DRAFT_896565 [Pholiota conissans]
MDLGIECVMLDIQLKRLYIHVAIYNLTESMVQVPVAEYWNRHLGKWVGFTLIVSLANRAAEELLPHGTLGIVKKITAPGLLTQYVSGGSPFDNFLISLIEIFQLIFYQAWSQACQKAAALMVGTNKDDAMRYQAYRSQLDKNPLSIEKIPNLADPDSYSYYQNEEYVVELGDE